MVAMDTRIFDYAYWPNFDKKIDILAQLSPEKWSFGSNTDNSILKNYISHTFLKLKDEYDKEVDPEEKKRIIYEDDKLACFNTGLFTSTYEPIYALFYINSVPGKQKWKFSDFKTEYQLTLIGVPVLPRRANYFTNPSDLVFDTNREIIPQWHHIINNPENFNRIPEQVRLGSNYQTVIEGAIKLAQKKIEANYRLAVPQYYKGKIQLLIPLCLIDRNRADLALVVTKSEEPKCYLGHTCLPLDWAYNNARLIARPDSDWLQP